MDNLTAQFGIWRAEVANPRAHATIRRVVDEAFTGEHRRFKPLPAMLCDAVLTVERRVKEGIIWGGGNSRSVPDTTRRRCWRSSAM